MKLVTFTSIATPASPPRRASSATRSPTSPPSATPPSSLSSKPAPTPSSPPSPHSPPTGRFPLSQVTHHAPIPRPPRVFGIGRNNHPHPVETRMELPQVPIVFIKLSSSVIGPDASIVLPKLSTKPDYEAELGFVIGKPGYQIPESSAMDHVFGYTVINDVSARDIQGSTQPMEPRQVLPPPSPPSALPSPLQTRSPTLTTCKSPSPSTAKPSRTPTPPTSSSKSPPSSPTSPPLPRSKPATSVSTGTPEGVGMGRDPKRWIKPNEEIIVTIEKLGSLRNPTVAE